MPTNGKSKYQRAVELAKSRGYASPYAERKARALAQGYSSPRTQYSASLSRKGRKRDYALERERANIRAKSRGFRSVADQAKFNKTPNANRELWQKRNTLNFFGISEKRFNEIRRLNKQWAKEYPMLQWTAINTYNEDIDNNVHDWTESRVGYILSFYAAIVDPDTNYDSLTKHHKRMIGKDGKRVTNKEQYYYLVKYTGIMSVDQYESRYGSAVARNARSGKLEVT